MDSIVIPLAEASALDPWDTMILFATPAVAMVGTFLCLGQMRRPMMNRVGIASLVAALLGIAGGTPVFLLQGNLSTLWLGILSLACGAIAVTGIATGCIALGLRRITGIEGGKTYAVWGLILNATLVAVGMTLFIRAHSGEMSSLAQVNAVPAIDPKATTFATLPEANCRLGYTDRQWIRSTNPETFEARSALVLRFIWHDLLLALSWWKDDGDAEFHMRRARGRLSVASPDLVTTMETKERFGQVEFLHFEGTGPIQKSALPNAHSFWFAAHGGTIYRIHAQSTMGGAEDALRETRKVLSTFSFIDPSVKPAPPATLAGTQDKANDRTPKAAPSDFWQAIARGLANSGNPDANTLREAAPEFAGFATLMAPGGWKSWTDAADSAPDAIFAARLGVRSYIVADTIPLEEKGVDLEEVATSFLARRTGTIYPSSSARSEPFTVAGADRAIRITHERTTEKIKLRFRHIVAVAGARAYHFVGWQVINAATDFRQIDDALASIRIPTDRSTLPRAPIATQRGFQADTVHHLALLASNRGDWPRASGLFQSAFRISQHNELTLASIVTCFAELGDPRSALDYLAAHTDRVTKSALLLAGRARMKATSADIEGAAADFAEAFEKGHQGEEDMRRYLTCLLTLKRNADAVKAADAFVAKNGASRLKRQQAQVYESAGDADGAIRIYEELFAKQPFDPLIAMELGETANFAGKYDRASEAAAALLKAGHDNLRTRMIEGWSHFGRKQWRDAKTAFEKARTFHPENPDVASALVRASAMLGEGDNSSVKKPLPVDELPRTLSAELEKIALDATPPKDASAWYLLRATVSTHRKGQPFSSTQHRRVRILEQSAVGDYSTLNFPFDPLSEEIFVNRLIVEDETGKVISEGQPEEQYLVDQATFSTEATHHKFLRVIVPGLKPGRTLDFSVTTRQRANSDAFPFQRWVVGTMHPTLAEAFALIGDIADIRDEASAEFRKLASKSQTKDTITWLVREPRVWKPEPRLPLADSYMPILCLGDTKADWGTEAREYLKQIDTLLKPDEPTRQLARELTSELKTNEQKVMALTRHVQKNVTYQAIEFGRRARIPKPPSRSLSSHYGDCKDQALLLHQLLAGAGIESHLALVNADTATSCTLPSLDQFNHMIVRVPSLKTGFVDPTASHLPGGALPPEIFKRHALVLDPAAPGLVSMPDRSQFTPDHLAIDTDISLSSSGEMQVNETLRVSGYSAAQLRRWLGEMPQSERLTSMQRGTTSSRWRLQDLAIDALDKDEADLLLKLRYSVPPPPASGSAGSGIVLPAVWEQQFLIASFLKERIQPFELVNPIIVESNVTAHAPKLPGADVLAAFSRNAKSDFCKWETKATLTKGKNDTLSLTFRFEGATGVFPAGRYSEWQTAWNAATEAWQSPIPLE